jgi:hypothetical protein
MDFMLMELQFGVIWLGIDTQYNVSSLHVNVSFDVSENLSFEGVVYDNGKVTGSLLVELQQNLINNDGVLSAPENNVYAIDNANATPLITPMIFSYTLGGNYLLNTKQSYLQELVEVPLQSDRILFSGLDYLDGNTKSTR